MLQGLGAELVFAALLYRKFNLPASLLAGTGAGLFCGLNDSFAPWGWNIAYEAGDKLAYISFTTVSGAVIAELGRDMDDVRQVSISISASSRAAAGASVAAAILSYVGRPVRLWRGRRWQQETGWHMLRRERYVVSHRRPITRVVALSDVPDHDVVPQMVRGKPATIFRAGPEFTATE